MNYNGWTNYETWVTKLWMDNDESSYLYWSEQARTATDVYALSKQLENEHEEVLPDVQGFAADLLNAAFRSIDWYEIAESLFDDHHEDENGS